MLVIVAPYNWFDNAAVALDVDTDTLEPNKPAFDAQLAVDWAVVMLVVFVPNM